jgi:hypothetical protein
MKRRNMMIKRGQIKSMIVRKVKVTILNIEVTKVVLMMKNDTGILHLRERAILKRKASQMLLKKYTPMIVRNLKSRKAKAALVQKTMIQRSWNRLQSLKVQVIHTQVTSLVYLRKLRPLLILLKVINATRNRRLFLLKHIMKSWRRKPRRSHQNHMTMIALISLRNLRVAAVIHMIGRLNLARRRVQAVKGKDMKMRQKLLRQKIRFRRAEQKSLNQIKILSLKLNPH